MVSGTVSGGPQHWPRSVICLTLSVSPYERPVGRTLGSGLAVMYDEVSALRADQLCFPGPSCPLPRDVLLQVRRGHKLLIWENYKYYWVWPPGRHWQMRLRVSWYKSTTEADGRRAGQQGTARNAQSVLFQSWASMKLAQDWSSTGWMPA